MIVSGHVNTIVQMTRANATYWEPPRLLGNDGNAVLRDMRGGLGISPSLRGSAIGDHDYDGNLDAIFVCLQGAPVLVAEQCQAGKFLDRIQLVGTRSDRDATGSKLMMRQDNQKLVRWITRGGSFFSGHDSG